MKGIPTNRIVDGIGHTVLLLQIDSHGRRDYVFICAGPRLGATVKGNVRRHWVSHELAVLVDTDNRILDKSPMSLRG
jgi:hypothetical protein